MTVLEQGSARPAAESSPRAPLVLEIDAARPLVELTRAVGEACDQAEAGDPRRALVLLLTGGAGGWPGGLGIHDVNRWERAVRRLERLSALTAAVADGECGGPALDLFLAVDYRLAGRDARLELRDPKGLPWPGMTLYRLAQQLGSARARRLLLGGAAVSAAQACALGLIDEISPDPARAAAAVAELAGIPGPELAVRRGLVLEASTVSYEDAIGTHLAACDRALRYAAGTGAAA